MLVLSVAFALTGCNKKPPALAEEQPVAAPQRATAEQAPQQAVAAQQPSVLLQAPVRPLQAPVPPPEAAASPSPAVAPAAAATESPPYATELPLHATEWPPQTAELPRPALAPNSDEPTPTPEPQKLPESPQDPLATRVGLFIPLTGSQASFGIEALNGAKLAVDEINEQGGVLDHPVNLIVKDTQSQTEQVASLVGELIDTEKVVALIGEITTDRTLAAAPVAQERGIPLITPSATNEKITAVGDLVFRVCYTDAFQAAMMTKFARSLDADKVAILFDGDNPYGTNLSNAFKVDFVKQGGSIVAEQTFRAGDVDYATQLNAIKLKNPDIVFLPSYFAEAAVIIKQARQLAIEVPFLGTDGWDSSELLKFAGQAVNNCYFASHFSSERLVRSSQALQRVLPGEVSSSPSFARRAHLRRRLAPRGCLETRRQHHFNCAERCPCRDEGFCRRDGNNRIRSRSKSPKAGNDSPDSRWQVYLSGDCRAVEEAAFCCFACILSNRLAMLA